MLTTFYLAKNDHRWVIVISLKTISCRPLLSLPWLHALYRRGRGLLFADRDVLGREEGDEEVIDGERQRRACVRSTWD